jgi:uncharacterized protein
VRILISGSTGTIGSALVAALEERGDEVARLVRPETTGADGVPWDPASGDLDPSLVSGFDAVVNLSGRSIGERRWSAAEKALLWESRVPLTAAIAGAVAAASPRPSVVVNASAVGYYGDGGDTVLDEESPAGTGFLADLVKAWEGATEPAAEAGARVVAVRSGIVLSTAGGALGRMLAPLGPRWLSPYRWGLGGPVGGGRQYWSWISLGDHVRGLVHLLAASALSGPVNLTSPWPVTNREFTKAMGRALRRPTVMPIPGFVVKAVLGSELARALVLEGQRVVPTRLSDDGFEFRDTDLEGALRDALGS